MRSIAICLAIVLALLTLVVGCAKKPQPTAMPINTVASTQPPGATAGTPKIAEDINDVFRAAQAKFVAKDAKGAAKDLDAGIEHVKVEAKQYGGDAGDAFMRVLMDLEVLSQMLDMGTVRTEADLKKVFSEVDFDLGRLHFNLAKKMHAGKDKAALGKEIRAAGKQWINAVTWGGKEKDVTGMAVAEEVRDMGSRIMQSGSTAGEDVDAAIAKLGKEYDRLGKLIKPSGKG